MVCPSILGKHPLDSNDNNSMGSSKKGSSFQDLSPRIPDKILTTILENIEISKEVVTKIEAAKIDHTYFSVKFHRITGAMQILNTSEEKEKETHVKVDFMFVSPFAISVNLEALSAELEATQQGITMTAAKILTLMTLLFGECSEVKRDQEFTHSQSFVSCLDCQKLEAIHAKKITDVWEGQLNNPRYYPYQLDAYTKFLVGLRYFEHEIDERYAWKPEWKSDLTRNEILVIERSDKTLRFCKVSSRINEGYRFLVGYQYQEHSYKHRGEEHLSQEAKKRW